MKATTAPPQNKKKCHLPNFQCNEAEEQDTQTLALLTDYSAQWSYNAQKLCLGDTVPANPAAEPSVRLLSPSLS